MTTKSNPVDAIVAKIIAAIEEGAGEFRMPWHRPAGAGIAMPRNVLTKKLYNGFNVCALWHAADTAGWQSGQWGTYKQWQAKGANVRKGEKGTGILFWKPTTYQRTNETTGEEETRASFLVRASWVFNAEQVDGYEDAKPVDLGPRDPAEIIASVDAYVANTGADISHGGHRAFYAPALDGIRLPPREAFVGTPTSTATESYYSVLLHELVHWTGDKKRCNRQFGKRFGDEAYAFEELVAELGAAFLCASLGISNEPRRDHAQYITSWLKVLKKDTKAIMTASSAASKATAYLDSLQPDAVADDADEASDIAEAA